MSSDRVRASRPGAFDHGPADHGPAGSGPVVRRFVLVSLVLPLVVAGIGLVVQVLMLPHVPGHVPLHWDASGRPDRYGAAWQPILFTVILGTGLPALIGFACLPGLRRGDRSPAYRVFGAQALGIATMQTLFATGLLGQSVEGGSAEEHLGWPLLVVGLGAGVVAAVAGWFLQPRSVPPSGPAAVVPLALAPGERVAWMRTTSLPTPAVVIIGTVTLVVALRAVLAWLVTDRVGLAWVLTGVAVLLTALVATTTSFHVRVDERGLGVCSVLGVPRFRVPLDDVTAVAVIDVRALGTIGGWGIRARPGRVTMVMRSGTGIQVTRRGGRRFVVTVPDARTGAALLEAFVARSRGAAGPAVENAGKDLSNG